jgi:anti-sigma regulatory factor (Ser/Thr protein kinase)
MIHFVGMARESRRPRARGDTGVEGYCERVLANDGSDVADVRHMVRELAENYGFGDRAGDLGLALDELIGNAKEHGAPPIVVRGWYDGRLIIEVSDGGEGFDYSSVRRVHPPPLLGHRGRGIWIVRQVADHVRVAIGDNDTTVRIELTHEPGIGA